MQRGVVSVRVWSLVQEALERQGVRLPDAAAPVPASPAVRMVSWDTLAPLLERVPEAVMREALRLALDAESLRLVVSGCTTPEQVYVAGWERLARKYAPDVGWRCELARPGVLHVEVRIPERLRECPAFGRAVAHAYRLLPERVGWGPSRVEAELGPRLTQLHVHLPQRRGTRKPPSRPTPADPVALAQEMDFAFGDAEITHSVTPVAQRMASESTLAGVAERFMDLVAERFCARYSALWWRPVKGAELQPVAWRGQVPEHGVVRRTLLVGTEDVGAVEVDLPAAGFGTPIPLLDAVLPWVGLGVAQVGRHGALGPGKTAVPNLDALSLRWNLTRRQDQVLRLLVGGASNRDIALELGTTDKTVEYHVTQVLRRAGVESRTMLLAAVLGAR